MSLEAKDTDPLLCPDQSPCRQFTLTVELPTLAFLFSTSLTDTVTSNLLLYRTCMNDLHYNATKCKLLHMTNKTREAKALESEVEVHTTFLIMTISIIAGVMPAILSAFLGSWSDKHGRKPLVMSPLLGQVLSSVLVIVYSALNSLSSWWFIMCILPYTIMGGSGAFILGSNLLITDITDDSNRSFRLALLYGCSFFGVLLGSVSSSYVYEAVGYVYLFGLSTVVYIISYLYTWLCVQETMGNATPGGVKDLFDMTLLHEMFAINFKRRRRVVGAMLFLLLSAYGLTTFCMSGVDNMDYFFTRQKFQWLLRQYNIFSAVNTIIIVFGMFVGMAFLQKVCRLSDGVLLILSYISLIAEAIVRCFAIKSWHMYLAGSMALLGGLSTPMIRSQVAKMIPKQEVAKMYSLITCVESILPVFSPLLFSTIYYKTLTTFPATIYGVSAGLYSACLLLVTISQIIYYRTPQDYYNVE